MADNFHGVLNVRKWGHSMVIVLPPELREFFQVMHRDLIAYRKVGRLVCLRRIGPSDLLPVTDKEAQESRS
jgi:antitoxin component of MazEF toxin-antitoxin module